MKNPLKPDQRADRDNPLVPNVIERPLERAADERTDERSRASAGGVHVGTPVADRPFVDDGPGDRPGAIDAPSAIARGDRPRATTATSTGNARQMDLFPNEELIGYRTRWEAIQTGFVDEPRSAVEQADALVAQVVNRLTEVFTRERSTLEDQWTKGDNVSTEDLRLALTRYRSFFHRLLSM
jgi:hypothetical protein